MRNMNNPNYKSLNAKLSSVLETSENNTSSYIKPDFKSISNANLNNKE